MIYLACLSLSTKFGTQHLWPVGLRWPLKIPLHKRIKLAKYLWNKYEICLGDNTCYQCQVSTMSPHHLNHKRFCMKKESATKIEKSMVFLKTIFEESLAFLKDSFYHTPFGIKFI